ncbi:MAG: carboxypeptidase regulatory-like domain-containing protein [Planctomycetes bacterium]|nr:carboxypeptidase regulatory-like domain-containing protein [Planctomycetota bacterium]
MGRWCLAAGALVLLATAVWLALGSGHGPDALPGAAESAGGASSPGPPPQATAPEPERAEEVQEDAVARVTGRFLLEGGAPAAGVLVWIDGRGKGSGFRATRKDSVAFCAGRQGLSGEDGRFLLTIDPDPLQQYALSGRLAGFAGVSWRWSSLAPGELKDIGTVELRRVGVVEGCIVNSRGEAVPGDWSVYISSSNRSPGEGGERTCMSVHADEATAAFRLEGVPAGTATLTARAGFSETIEGPTVEVLGGQTIRADLVYQGPPLARRIAATTFNDLLFTYSAPDLERLRLWGAGDSLRAFEHLDGSAQTYVVDDVEPGFYTVELDDPRFDPVRVDGVRPGTEVKLALRGSAAVRLELLDDATGLPIPSCGLAVRMDRAYATVNEFEVWPRNSGIPENGLVDHLIPESQTLILEADGYARTEVPLVDLRPNEVRPVTVRLARGSAVRGHAREGGKPAGLLPLLIFRCTDNPFAFESPVIPAERYVREVVTAVDGSFAFDRVAPGTYDLLARKDWGVVAVLSGIEIDGSNDVEVLAVLPGEGSLAGRLAGPPQADYSNLAIRVAPDLVGLERMFSHPGQTPCVEGPVDAQGRFQVGGIRAGPAHAYLRLPDVVTPSVCVFGISPGATVDLGAVHVVAGETHTAVFDVTDSIPGRLLLSVLVDGVARPDLVFEASTDTGLPGGSAGGSLGESMPANSGPMLPGSWRLTIRPVDASWRYRHPDAVQVVAGRAVAVPVSIVLRSGEVSVIDPGTKQSLRNQWVEVSFEDGSFCTRSRTDGEGVMSLTLPEGSYRLAAGDYLSMPEVNDESPRLPWSGATLPEIVEVGEE